MSTVDRRTTALMRRLAAVLFAALAAGLGLTTWSSGEAATAPAEQQARAARLRAGRLRAGRSTQELRSALGDARRSCSTAALDAAVAAIEAHARAPQADAAAWTLFAEALLERAQFCRQQPPSDFRGRQRKPRVWIRMVRPAATSFALACVSASLTPMLAAQDRHVLREVPYPRDKAINIQA